MVGENHNWMGGAHEILAPFREGMYDSKKFSVINVVVLCGRGEYF